jgi:hypothetical protein
MLIGAAAASSRLQELHSDRQHAARANKLWQAYKQGNVGLLGGIIGLISDH